MNTTIFKKAIAPATTLICLALIFWTPWLTLIKDWQREEYSHGFILPFIAILMAWHKVSGQKLSVTPSLWGFFYVLCGLCVWGVSELSTLRQLSYYAMLLCIIGLSFAYLGTRVTKAIFPAFGLLLLAIPLPNFLFNNFSLFLQLVSSSLGVTLLQSAGVSVLLDGNIIDLGKQKLQVVEACSGLRYLFPLTSFSFLLAYLLKDRFWKRAVLFLSALPIGIAMNAVRIAFIGLLSQKWDVAVTEGFLHYFEGLTVFLLCLGALFIEVFVLLRIGKQGAFDWRFCNLPQDRLFIRPVLISKVSLSILALTLVVAALTTSGVMYQNRKPVALQTPLNAYPMSYAGWTGHQSQLDRGMLQLLTPTDYIIADFNNAQAKAPINFYIAYYAEQELLSSAHSPSTCLPGSGWEIESATNKDISLGTQTNPQPHTLSRLLLRQGSAKQIIYYWFDQRGRTITNQFAAKWYLLVDGLASGRSDGALVRFATAVSPSETEAEADQRLTNFVKLSYPLIRERLR